MEENEVMENEQQDAVAQDEQKQQENLSRGEKRIQDDLMLYKKQVKELEADREKLRHQMSLNEQRVLEEKGKFKELWEKERERVNELQSKYESQKESVNEYFKRQALEREALKLGIKEEALEDLSYLDTSNLILETTNTGKVSVIGADAMMEELKAKKSYWFKDNSAPNINTGNPSYQKREYSAHDLLKLQQENPAKYKAEMMKRFGR